MMLLLIELHSQATSNNSDFGSGLKKMWSDGEVLRSVCMRGELESEGIFLKTHKSKKKKNRRPCRCMLSVLIVKKTKFTESSMLSSRI